MNDVTKKLKKQAAHLTVDERFSNHEEVSAISYTNTIRKELNAEGPRHSHEGHSCAFV